MISAQLKQQGYDLVIHSAQALPGNILAAAGRGLARGLLAIVGISQRQYLQGPRPQRLGEVTTRLRQSIASSITVTPSSVTGRIGSNVRYAAFHEFGFNGTEQVRGFTRVLSRITGIGHVVGGRADNGRYLASGGKKAAGKQKAGAVEFEYVKAHSRRINYAGRPFIGPALKDGQPLIITSINEELSKLN